MDKIKSLEEKIKEYTNNYNKFYEYENSMPNDLLDKAEIIIATQKKLISELKNIGLKNYISTQLLDELSSRHNIRTSHMNGLSNESEEIYTFIVNDSKE